MSESATLQRYIGITAVVNMAGAVVVELKLADIDIDVDDGVVVVLVPFSVGFVDADLSKMAKVRAWLALLQRAIVGTTESKEIIGRCKRSKVDAER